MVSEKLTLTSIKKQIELVSQQSKETWDIFNCRLIKFWLLTKYQGIFTDLACCASRCITCQDPVSTTVNGSTCSLCSTTEMKLFAKVDSCESRDDEGKEKRRQLHHTEELATERSEPAQRS